MAYYVGTQQFPSVYAAARFLSQNPQPGVSITSNPVGTTKPAPATTKGMLTKAPVKTPPKPVKPAPVKQTAPTVPRQQTPGQSGPFDPAGGPVGGPPKPTPTATPTAPSPEGYSKVDFSQPSAPEEVVVPPPPTPPRPVDVVPPAPVKPAPTTKEDVKAAEEAQPEMTFTFFKGQEKGDANPAALYNRADSTAVTLEDLNKYFNDENSKMLQEAFGDFDNYLAYMTEREQLIQSGEYDVGNWVEQGVTEAGLNEDQRMLFEGDADLTVDPSDPMQNIENLETTVGSSRQTAYDRWVNSEENQALLEKYGVGSTIYNDDGDRYEWNGSAYVKTMKVDDHLGVGDYMRIGMGVALGAAVGPALGGALTGSTGAAAGAAAGTTGAAATTTGAFAQGAVNKVIGSAIAQGVATGSVDASQLATAAITGGIGGVADGIQTGELAGTAASNAISDLADVTGLSVEETVDIVEGVLNGAVTGEDVEDIAIGAVQGYTSGQIKNIIQDTFGDEIDVENVFDEGTTTIPTEALDPFVETAVNAVFEGEIQAEDVLGSLVDYAQEGGSFGFLDPGLDIPDIDLDLFGNMQVPDFGDTPEEIKAIEDVVRTVGSATEDVVRTVGSTTEDVVRAGGQAVAPIVEPPAQAIGDVLAAAEDVVRPIGSAAEDVVRTVGSATEDVVRPIGSAAEDVVRTVGSAADEYVIQPIREALPTGTTPDIDLPSVDLPSVDLPSVDLPSVDIGMPQLAGGGGGMFSPYTTNIGYAPVQLQQLITSPYGAQPANQVSNLALDDFFARNSIG